MALSKRVGAILKEAREGRNLSIQDVARQTRIVARFIDALENENYSIFPGETYTLGFLRNYADFLELDTEHLVHMYLGHQIDLSEAPLPELTKPIHSSFFREKNFWLALSGAALLAAGIFWWIYFPLTPGPQTESRNPVLGDVLNCSDRRVQPITLLPGVNLIYSLQNDNALEFSVDSRIIKLCTARLEEHRLEEHRLEEKMATLHLLVNRTVNHTISAPMQETLFIAKEIQELAGLSGNIFLTPRDLDLEKNTLSLELGSAAPTQSIGGIQITLQFIGDSYVEWMNDGAVRRGMQIARGEIRTLEARELLKIKLGNGGGVRILREGKEPLIAGLPGQIVNLTYSRTPDPLDPGIFRITEKIEVVD